jgi:hypothetical protein
MLAIFFSRLALAKSSIRVHISLGDLGQHYRYEDDDDDDDLALNWGEFSL